MYTFVVWTGTTTPLKKMATDTIQLVLCALEIYIKFEL
jgi:hypothetical protein